MVYIVCSSNTTVAYIVINTIFVLNEEFFFWQGSKHEHYMHQT